MLLTLALFAGLSTSPAPTDASELRDPFAPRVASVETVEASSSPELVDPFSRPRAATVARTSTELSDPFAAPRADYGLRDPFAATTPAPRLATASTPSTELADPFAVRQPSRLPSQASSDLHDPFAR